MYYLLNVLKQQNEGVMEYQRLKKVIVTKDQWTIANGLLTPTLKNNHFSPKCKKKLREKIFESYA